MEESIIIVVDTNILFTFFWKESKTPEILLKKKVWLIAPELALLEINKYSEIIMKKANIPKKEFQIIKNDLGLGVVFFPLKEYSKFMQKAESISPDKNDIDFFALALRYNCIIWSNDRKLKEQKLVEVLNTKEVIELLG